MIRRPPGSTRTDTLFPYTTLFRSAGARGDVTALEELADDELKANPNVRKVLLTSRNARWADWIAKRMDTPGTVFVAVGAGHLAGDDSVQHMLGLKKLDVERVQ